MVLSFCWLLTFLALSHQYSSAYVTSKYPSKQLKVKSGKYFVPSSYPPFSTWNPLLPIIEPRTDWNSYFQVPRYRPPTPTWPRNYFSNYLAPSAPPSMTWRPVVPSVWRPSNNFFQADRFGHVYNDIGSNNLNDGYVDRFHQKIAFSKNRQVVYIDGIPYYAMGSQQGSKRPDQFNPSSPGAQYNPNAIHVDSAREKVVIIEKYPPETKPSSGFGGSSQGMSVGKPTQPSMGYPAPVFTPGATKPVNTTVAGQVKTTTATPGSTLLNEVCGYQDVDLTCGLDEKVCLREHPWLAVLFSSAQGTEVACTGVLVHPEYVLATAHCVTNL